MIRQTASQKARNKQAEHFGFLDGDSADGKGQIGWWTPESSFPLFLRVFVAEFENV
jgi:hypothetical protein